MKKVTKEELDYLFSRIDWGKSFLDAKAIEIMNRTDTLFEDETREALEAKSKSCEKDLRGKKIHITIDNKKYVESVLKIKKQLKDHRFFFLSKEEFKHDVLEWILVTGVDVFYASDEYIDFHLFEEISMSQNN